MALALGAETVRAIDVDPDAVAVTRENAARNSLSERLACDATSIDALDGRYDTVLANIEAKTLVELATALTARVAPGGALVLSGILATEVAPAQLEDVRRAYAALELDDVKEKGEWLSVSLRSPR